MQKRIVGMSLIVVFLFALGFWEFWGRKNLGYQEVLTVRKELEPNTVISADMLSVKKLEVIPQDALSPEDAESIIGLESKQLIPQGETLYAAYFEESSFTVGGESGKYVLSIPNDWLKSYPQTLRRGDSVYFYCKGSIVTEAVVAYARDGSNQEVRSQDDSRLIGSAPVSLVEVIVDEKQAKLLGNLADKGNKFVLLYS